MMECVPETHDFKPKTYLSPTKCVYCNTMLLGVYKQGVTCTSCGRNYHKECSLKAYPYCAISNMFEIPKNPLVRVSTVTRNTSDKLCSLWYGLMKYSTVMSSEVVHFWLLTPDEIKIYEEANMNKKILSIQLGNIVLINRNRLSNDQLMKPKNENGSNDSSIFTIRTKKNAYFCGNIDESDEIFHKNTKTFSDNLSLALLPYKMRSTNPSKMTWKINNITIKTSDIDEHYIVDFDDESSYLGEGTFGKVYKGICQENKKAFAIKEIKRPENSKEIDINEYRAEINILYNLKHPNIVSLIDIFIDEVKRKIYIVTELLNGGDLLEVILKQPERRLSEKVTKFIMYQVFEALQYLHDMGIAHCDLKPENILLVSQEEYPQIKLCDFGYAKIIEDNTFRNSNIGTMQYMSPEVMSGEPYNKLTDVWSAGVCIYVSLVGVFPFDEVYVDHIFEFMKNEHNIFPFNLWSSISSEVKSLLRNYIFQPRFKRKIIAKCLKHVWFKNATTK